MPGLAAIGFLMGDSGRTDGLVSPRRVRGCVSGRASKGGEEIIDGKPIDEESSSSSSSS